MYTSEQTPCCSPRCNASLALFSRVCQQQQTWRPQYVVLKRRPVQRLRWQCQPARHQECRQNVAGRRGGGLLRASAEAGECLQKGQQKYEAGDRMGALRHFEDALKQSPTLPQRRAAHFNATAVHASFGDVELAQITLRDGVNAGLDFERALKAGDEEGAQLVKFQGSPQIVIQLRKFAEAVKRIKGAVEPAGRQQQGATSAAPAKAPRAVPSGGEGGGVLGRDMSSTLRTDMTGIDPSLGGIIRRVAGVLVAAVLLGAALFYVGLQLTFPSYG